MSSTKFLAVLPQTVQPGDKVQIKGQVCDNAQEFSINFANETCRNPDNITYHFKWILAADIIVENYKQNGEWMDHKESEYTVFDGRFSNNLALENENSSSNSFSNHANQVDAVPFINSYSILGPVFALEFAFQDDGIYVYLVYGDGRNIITQFIPEFDLSEIKSIQVWGDVEKVKQLSFFYK